MLRTPVLVRRTVWLTEPVETAANTVDYRNALLWGCLEMVSSAKSQFKCKKKNNTEYTVYSPEITKDLKVTVHQADCWDQSGFCVEYLDKYI